MKILNTFRAQKGKTKSALLLWNWGHLVLKSLVVPILGREENLYKIMVQTGRFSESLARYCFKQIIDAVEYMHNSGVAHCDIKLENIIFDYEFNIKICDFGFSTEERTRSNKKGTSNYLAPEVFINSEYETFPADIFAIGIVLFEMIKGIYPFGSATIGDKYFSLLQSKNSYFWKVHSKRETKGFFSEELKYLINGMLNVDIDQRFTFEDIKKSDWYNGDCATSDEVKLELSQRCEIIASNCTQ